MNNKDASLGCFTCALRFSCFCNNYLAAVGAQEHILLIRGHLKRKEGDTFAMDLRGLKKEQRVFVICEYLRR